MDSTRLPNKVMMTILGKPVIWHIYHRLMHCKTLDNVVVSTGDYEKNKEIIDFSKENNIPVFSGSEHDLIQRLFQTAEFYGNSSIVRITSDCPLVDPHLVDKLVNDFKNNHNEYDILTNCDKHTFPHGLDIEVYSFKILKKLNDEIQDTSLREWFPVYIKKNRKKFKIFNIENNKNLSHYRLTLDYEEDFEVIKKIYEKLYDYDRIFTMTDVMSFLNKHPEIAKINSKYVGNYNFDSPEI